MHVQLYMELTLLYIYIYIYIYMVHESHVLDLSCEHSRVRQKEKLIIRRIAFSLEKLIKSFPGFPACSHHHWAL
jgi:hypothetical protein